MQTSDAPRLRDRSALHKTILRYTLFSRIIGAVVVVVVALLWWAAAKWVIHFGSTRDYAVFDTLGSEVLTWVERYHPFFWWGLVIICSIFIAYSLYVFVVFIHRRSQMTPISARSVELLLRDLGPASREVLDWVWHDRREPITVGVLQRTVQALRQGRYEQIKLSHTHAQLIEESLKNTPPQPTATVGDKEVLHTI